MPYTHFAIAICIIVGFYKIAEIDEEIGNPLGLTVGALVILADFFPEDMRALYCMQSRHSFF